MIRRSVFALPPPVIPAAAVPPSPHRHFDRNGPQDHGVEKSARRSAGAEARGVGRGTATGRFLRSLRSVEMTVKDKSGMRKHNVMNCHDLS